MKNDFRALAAAQQDEPSVENVLPRMTVPSLLYCGDADPNYPSVQKCAQAMPNARFFTLHGLDHGATFREAGLVLPNVITFLQAATKASSQPV